MRVVLSALLLASASILGTPLAAASSAAPVPLSTLADQVKLPYDQFTLANGLRVIVSTDRKAPIVGASIWYHVGSKDEVAGKTGFAHLFEHLMFYGSENVPGGIVGPLEKAGANDYNGTTSFDRTNYFETVPTPALPLTLFLESDRMGHLLGAVTQQTLDRQRGVVQNEKRQRDNGPYGLVSYAQQQALFPEGHPYHHLPIGSMADIDHASLGDVRHWFQTHYGPNNAVLVLAGDIDVATARPMVEKYFGDIPRGPQPAPTLATVPTLKAPVSETLHDQVATVRLYRDWATPGYTDKDMVPLDIASSILGGLASSRLDDSLVRQEKLAVGVSASIEPEERVGQFEITVDVRPGVDPKLVNQRLDAILADFLAHGPTADEIDRAVTQEVAGRLFSLEHVGGFDGKAVTLAEGAVYAGDPGYSAKQLKLYAAATPAEVQAAAKRWLSRPAYSLTILPGARAPYEEAKAVQDDGGKAIAPAPAAVAPSAPPKLARIAPPAGEIVNLAYPTIQHATLSNGIRIVYAQRKELPLTRIIMSFDAGYATDPKGALGTASLTLGLLDEGTATRSAAQIAADQERLGSRISIGASMDRSSVSLAAVSANFAPTLDLLADVIRNTSFADIDRLRGEQLSAIQSELSDPGSLANRSLPALIYGPDHPYGVPDSGLGDPAVVARLTKADLQAFKNKWVRPSDATIYLLSDLPLATLTPLLESRFGDWSVPGSAGTSRVDQPIAPSKSQIVLIDRPGSPQSVVLAGEVLEAKGTDDLLPLIAANDTLGGGLSGRLSIDIRDTRAWSYGVNSALDRYVGRIPFNVSASVQTDKTGPAISAMIGDLKEFVGAKPITQDERDRTVEKSIRELPGSYESGGALLGAMQRNDTLKRPDDYYVHIADLYRGLTTEQLNAVARTQIRPAELVWVVVGDAKRVKPQLDAVGLPVEVAKAPDAR